MDRRVIVPIDAAVLSAALGKPDVAVGIGVDGAHRAHCSTLRRLEPVRNFYIRVRLRRGWAAYGGSKRESKGHVESYLAGHYGTN